MKVYPNTHSKDARAYVLYADSDNILYHDAAKTKAVKASEVPLMFYTGIFVTISGALTVATAAVLASESTAYATVTVGSATYYTSEYEPEED